MPSAMFVPLGVGTWRDPPTRRAAIHRSRSAPLKRSPCSWMPLVLRASLAASRAGTASPSAAPSRTPMLQVTNWLSGDLSTLAVQADGSLRGPLWLTPMPGSPDRPRNPLVAVPSPDGRTLYVSDWGSSELAAFRISRSGRPRPLAAVPPAPPAPSNPAGLAVTPDGQRLLTWLIHFSA